MKVTDIMTASVISVQPETTLVEAARLMTEHKFNGLPVTDTNGVLLGIITEYGLISNQSGIHLPTLQTVLSKLPIFSKDKSEFAQQVEAVTRLTARDVMNADPLTLPNTASYEETVRAFQDHHGVNPIPVIDSTRKLVGVVSRYDILKPLTH